MSVAVGPVMSSGHLAVPPESLLSVGLVGGIGPAATRFYYDRLINDTWQRCGRRPRILIDSLDFDRFTWLEDHDVIRYTKEIVRSLQTLEQAGAQVLAMAANSAHAVLQQVGASVSVPLVSIVESVCRAAWKGGIERALLLGIPATMRASFYPAVASRYGLHIEVPDPRHHSWIRSVVFDELTFGHVLEGSRSRMISLLDEHDVDALILGCTELSELFEGHRCPVPVLDSARLHVADIVDHLTCDTQE